MRTGKSRRIVLASFGGVVGLGGVLSCLGRGHVGFALAFGSRVARTRRVLSSPL